MMAEKNHQKISNNRYKKGLNKNDPFDQLIIDLAQSGKLDVSIVEIKPESTVPQTHEYSRKSLHHRGEYSS